MTYVLLKTLLENNDLIYLKAKFGEVQEWLNWLPWKGSVFARVPWVRIPPSPQLFSNARF